MPEVVQANKAEEAKSVLEESVEKAFKELEQRNGERHSVVGSAIVTPDDILARGTEEEKEVVRKYMNTPQWMPAPNGNPTNLNTRQWMQLRTPSFKKLVGDWETLEKIDAILKMTAVDISEDDSVQDEKELEEVFKSFGTIVNQMNGDTATFPLSTVGKIFRHKGLSVTKFARVLHKLFESSIHFLTEDEISKEGHKEHRNIKAYHHYVNRVNVDGINYYVRFTSREENVKKNR